MGASNHVIGLRGGRLRIGVLDGVFGISHTPTGEKGEAAANGNAIYRGDAGLALEGRGGSVQGAGTRGHTALWHRRRQQPSVRTFIPRSSAAKLVFWIGLNALSRSAKQGV